MLRCTELIRLPSSLTCLAEAGRNQQSVTEWQENPLTSNVVGRYLWEALEHAHLH